MLPKSQRGPGTPHRRGAYIGPGKCTPQQSACGHGQAAVLPAPARRKRRSRVPSRSQLALLRQCPASCSERRSAKKHRLVERTVKHKARPVAFRPRGATSNRPRSGSQGQDKQRVEATTRCQTGATVAHSLRCVLHFGNVPTGFCTAPCPAAAQMGAEPVPAVSSRPRIVVRVACRVGGLSCGWLVVWVACRVGGLSCGWLVVWVACRVGGCRVGGLSCGWLVVRAACPSGSSPAPGIPGSSAMCSRYGCTTTQGVPTHPGG